VNIIVDIRPEVQAELVRQAAAHGRALEAHAASLLEEAAHLSGTNGAKQRPEETKGLVEVCAMVRGLTEDVEFSRNPSTDRPVEL